MEGYLVNFYKKLYKLNKENNPKKMLSNKVFDFITWMYFDGITVKAINSFSDNLDDDNKRFENCEKQKLYLYEIIENKDDFNIFESRGKSDEAKDNPLITISIINIKPGKKKIDPNDLSDAIDKIKSAVINTRKIDKSGNNPATQKNNKSIESIVYFRLLGTLSANDYALVCRSNNYQDVFDMIFLIRKLDYVDLSYTIAGLNANRAFKWNKSAEERLSVSMRIALLPQIPTEEISESIRRINDSYNAINVNENETYNTLGQYDLGISGKLKRPSGLVKLFDDPRDIHGETDINKLIYNGEKAVRSTNTRLAYTVNKNELKIISDLNELFNLAKSEPNPFIYDNKTQTYLDIMEIMFKYIYCKNISPDYNKGFERLWLRTYQLLGGGYDNHIFDDVFKGVLGFIKLTKNHIRDKRVIDDIAQGLDALNTLIDNRELNYSHEFENSHNNLMFTDSSSCLIARYSKITSNIFNFIKDSNNDNKRYYSFLTVEGYSEVTVRHLFSISEDVKLINICIPVEMMFHFKYILAWTVHELGHFSRIGWEKENRNNAFFRSMWIPYHGLLSHIGYNLEGVEEEIISRMEPVHNPEEASFDLYVNKLMKSGLSTLFSIHKPKDRTSKKMADVFPDFLKDLDFYQNAYKESIADMFMIMLLGIKTEYEYIDIVYEYFKYKNISVSEISENNMIRIGTVLSTFFDEASNISDEFEYVNACSSHINVVPILHDSSKSKKDIVQIENLYSQINKKVYSKKYICLSCYFLFKFLKEEVQEGFLKRYEENEYINTLQKFYLSFNKNNVTEISNVIDFIVSSEENEGSCVAELVDEMIAETSA